MAGQDWGQGYVTELEYTSNFYRELSPHHLQFAALSKQLTIPNVSQSFNYLELGCGNGVTVNALAVNHPHSQFWGLDFNPSHIVNAQEQARLADIDNASFHDWSFEEALIQDLPKMDFIVLHGIYSWVSAENRQHICALIKKLLRPGGIVYLSYNCLPGWSQAAPLRRLMMELANREGGTVLEKLKAVKQILPQLSALPLQYTQLNPHSKLVHETIATKRPQYVVHEYMNMNWDLFYFTDVAAQMHEVKLTYAASANVLENFMQTCATPETVQFIEVQADPVMRELMLDYATNKRFRRDIYMRGVPRLSEYDYETQVMSTQICLARTRTKCDLNVQLPMGKVDLPTALYAPLLDALATGPKPLGELANVLNVSASSIMNAAGVLVGLGYACASVAEVSAEVAMRAKRFNQAILTQTSNGSYQSTLVAPKLAAGVHLDEFEQYFVKAYLDKSDDPALYVWKIMKKLRRFFAENGAPITDETKSLVMLRERVLSFEQISLPLCKMWGIL